MLFEDMFSIHCGHKLAGYKIVALSFLPRDIWEEHFSESEFFGPQPQNDQIFVSQRSHASDSDVLRAGPGAWPVERATQDTLPWLRFKSQCHQGRSAGFWLGTL